MARIIGRDRELDRVAAFLSGDPGASCLVIQGEPGVGKSTLWRRGVDLAGARGFTVLLSRPLEFDMAIPFCGLHDLLGSVLGEVLDALPGPQRRALATALLIDDPVGPPPESGAIAFALLRALEVLARRAPVLVGIDDVHWLDEPSATVLRFAMHRTGRAVVRLLVAQRVHGKEADPLGLERVVEPDRYTLLTLGGLSLGSIQHIITAELGVVISRPLLVKVHATSGGNPLFALELARALRRHPGRVAPGRPLPVPDALSALVQDRLAVLPGAAQRGLEIAALLSDPTVSLVRAAADGEIDLAPAVRAGVMELDQDRIRFTHPLLASGVAERISDERRRSLHRRLAGLVADPAERARHHALGASGVDPAAAVALDEAARLALARGAPAIAADLLDQALQHTPEDEPRRGRRLLAAAEATYRAGDWERALALVEQAAALLSAGPDRLKALLLLGEIDGRIPELEQAVIEAGDDALMRARIKILLAQNWVTRSMPESLRLARAAACDARAAADDAMLTEALSFQAWFEGATVAGDPDATVGLAARHALSGGHAAGGDDSAMFTLATLRMWRDEHELARRGFEALRERGEQAGRAFDEAHALLNLAQVEWRAGRWERAGESIEQAISLWPRGDQTARSLALWIGAVLAVHRGQLDAARASAEEGSAAAGEHLLFRGRNLWVIGCAALGAGQVDQALSYLGEADALFGRVGALEPGMRLFVPDLLDAYLAAGQLGQAEALATDLLRRGAELARPRATVLGLRARGLVLAARGQAGPALDVLAAAAVTGERWPVPLEHARTLLALGTVQRQALHRREARATLGQAHTIFEQLGAALFAERAGAELGRIAGRTATGQVLTPSEQRVAELVARGLSNREVARDLVIEVHTVESALTHIYRKLGVRSRSELALRFARRPGNSFQP